MVRVHAIHDGCGEDGAGGSGHILVNYDRESPVIMTGLSLGPRGSGAVNTVVASGNPAFAGPTLPLKNAHVLGPARVEPPINRRGGLRMRWPGIGRKRLVLESGTSGSHRFRQVALLIGGRRRVEHPSRARRLGLLAPTPQDHRENKGIRLGQAISHVWGWTGGRELLGGGGVGGASSFKVEAGPSSRILMAWRL